MSSMSSYRFTLNYTIYNLTVIMCPTLKIYYACIYKSIFHYYIKLIQQLGYTIACDDICEYYNEFNNKQSFFIKWNTTIENFVLWIYKNKKIADTLRIYEEYNQIRIMRNTNFTIYGIEYTDTIELDYYFLPHHNL